MNINSKHIVCFFFSFLLILYTFLEGNIANSLTPKKVLPIKEYVATISLEEGSGFNNVKLNEEIKLDFLAFLKEYGQDSKIVLDLLENIPVENQSYALAGIKTILGYLEHCSSSEYETCMGFSTIKIALQALENNIPIFEHTREIQTINRSYNKKEIRFKPLDTIEMSEFDEIKFSLFNDLLKISSDDRGSLKGKICSNSCPKSTINFIGFPENSFVETSNGKEKKNLDETRDLIVSNVNLDKEIKLIFLKPPFNVPLIQKIEMIPSFLFTKWLKALSYIVGLIIVLCLVMVVIRALLPRLFSLKSNGNSTNNFSLKDFAKPEAYSKSRGSDFMSKIFNFDNSPIGSVANEGTIGTSAGRIENQNNHPPQNLAEAAREIQLLLEQLSQAYPTRTDKEKRLVAIEAIERIENNPDWKKRIVNAAKKGGLAAIEKGIEKGTDSIIASTITGAIKGWIGETK